MGIKLEGSSGQDSVNKALAAQNTGPESLASKDAWLEQSFVIPANEAWLHTPEMQARLKAVCEWADCTLRRDTDLDALDRAYAAGAPRVRDRISART